jgi:DNA-binding MarR family transcriptional regulator
MLYRGELPRSARRTYRGDVSPGAWLTYQAIAARRPLPGGLRQVKRTELAGLVCRTPRQVARYLAELRAAGYIEVVVSPPTARRARLGNRYRLP